MRSGKHAMRSTPRRARPLRRVSLGVTLLVAVLLLAGCGSGSGGSSGLNFNLGLAGSTNDHPADPPTIAPGGPDGSYAFIYDNQVWLRRTGQDKPKQLTHLVLSNGATLQWGPLVWSHSGKYIAFVLVQDLNPSDGAPRTSGPMYYADTSNGQVSDTGATGSIYGHTYTWLGDAMLLFASGSGLQLYTLDNPRVWQVRDIPSAPSGFSQADYASVGDLAAANGTVYYTRLDIRSPGHTGVVGTATLMRTFLGITDQNAQTAEQTLGDHLPLGDAGTVGSLGSVYADSSGAYIAGAWQVTAGRFSSSVALQRIDSVDAQAGTLASTICLNQVIGDSCDARVLSKAGAQPLSAHPQLAFSRDGKVAFAGDNLFVQGTDAKLGPAGWTAPPAWAPDGQSVVVTQFVSQSTDANGVLRAQTNLVLYKGGQGTTLIAGGRNLAWAPA